MKKQKLFLTVVTVAASLSFAIANAQTKETTIKEKSGSTTTVRTDSRGTQTSTDGKAVYSSGGDRHKEQVDYSTKQGGSVTSNKTTK